MIRQVPNLLTCLNLLCGCFSIIFIFSDNIDAAASMVLACLIFDFLDGFTARLLSAGSSLGKELDSLADMVSFGLVPGLLGSKLCLSSPPFSLNAPDLQTLVIGHFPLIITLASAIRLARFNLDTRQTDSFIGVPTPAITILMIGLCLTVEHDRFSLTPVILNPWFVCGLSMVIAWLLNCDLRMIALKFKSFSWSANQWQYLLIFSSAACFVLLGFTGIPACILLYVFISLISGKPSNQPKENPIQNEIRS